MGGRGAQSRSQRDFGERTERDMGHADPLSLTVEQSQVLHASPPVHTEDFLGENAMKERKS